MSVYMPKINYKLYIANLQKFISYSNPCIQIIVIK